MGHLRQLVAAWHPLLTSDLMTLCELMLEFRTVFCFAQFCLSFWVFLGVVETIVDALLVSYCVLVSELLVVF